MCICMLRAARVSGLRRVQGRGETVEPLKIDSSLHSGFRGETQEEG